MLVLVRRILGVRISAAETITKSMANLDSAIPKETSPAALFMAGVANRRATAAAEAVSIIAKVCLDENSQGFYPFPRVGLQNCIICSYDL